MIQPQFKAPDQKRAVPIKNLYRDTRTSFEQMIDGFKSPIMLGGSIFGLGVIPFVVPEATFFTIPLASAMYFLRMNTAKKEHLPFRMPFTSFKTDYGDPTPGRKGFSKASGTFFLGNTFGEHTSELWMGIRDMLTHMLIFGTTGSGKAQPLYAKVLTPSGWQLMGNIQPGDKVISADGAISNVLATYPQPSIPIYKITFADGRTAQACGDHLWEVHHKHWSGKYKKGASRAGQATPRILSTEALSKLLLSNKGQFSVPLFAPSQASYTLQELPLDPYVMGCLLGDGGFRKRGIRFSTGDHELLELIQSKLPETTEIHYYQSDKPFDYWIRYRKEHRTSGRAKDGSYSPNPVLKAIRELGLENLKSHEKIIPEAYLNSSLHDRMELIKGLMDTDGTVGKGGDLSFTSTSHELAKQVQTLIWSIGGIVKLSTKKTSYKTNGETSQGRDAYTISIRYKEPSALFNLTRKRDRCLTYQYSNSLKLGIKKIELVGNELAKCIYIDHPSHLYVTDDYVVTHNTEALVSLSFNAIAMGSGLFYVDPKGSPKLIAQLYVMSRICGRDDDFRCINYLTAEKSAAGSKMPLRTTHMINTFSYGNAESLSNMLNSLIAKSEGSNAIFGANARNLMKSVMYALVEMRDNGEIQLSAKTIRDYLTLSKVMSLAERNDFSRNTTDAIRAFLTSVGWQEGRDEKSQPKSLAEQFGYARSYFGDPLNNLTDTYGHIYGTPFGEIDMRDVVMNRRILAIIIPSLAMAQEEVKSLGVISLSAIRIAIAVGLGTGKEGSFDDVLYSLPTDAPAPFLSITDEYAAIPTPGYVEVLTQGRGLGIAAIVASQDFAGITKADKEGAQQLLENTKFKLFMKGSVAGETFDVAKGLAGEVSMMETSGFVIKPDSSSMMMDYRDNLSSNVKDRNRISLADIQGQIEGEFHAFFGSILVRGMMFYAAPKLDPDYQIQYSHMVAIYPPETNDINVKFGLINKITVFLTKQFNQLPPHSKGSTVLHYVAKKEDELISAFEDSQDKIESDCDAFNVICKETFAKPLVSPMDTAIAAFVRFHKYRNKDDEGVDDFLALVDGHQEDNPLAAHLYNDLDDDDASIFGGQDDYDDSDEEVDEVDVEVDEEIIDQQKQESIGQIIRLRDEAKGQANIVDDLDDDIFNNESFAKDVLDIERAVTLDIKIANQRATSAIVATRRMHDGVVGAHPTQPVPANDPKTKNSLANKLDMMLKSAQAGKDG